MEAVIRQQLEIGAEIAKIYKDYTQSDDRSADTIIEIDQELEKAWKSFDSNNSKLVTMTVDFTHEYFTKGKYDDVQKVYSFLKSRIGYHLNPSSASTSDSGTEIGTESNGNTKNFKMMKVISGINNESDEQQKLKRKWNLKMEILREILAKTQSEFGRNASFYQQKIRSLEAQWKDIVATNNTIFENDCSDEMKALIANALEEYDNGMASIYDKIQSMEQVKLPQINIPVFDGSYALWTNFYDIFSQAIHKNTQLGEVQKFQYLKTHTEGEANQIIRHLQTTAENYRTAWEIMKARYNNERRLVHSYYVKLRDLPKLEEQSAIGLRNIYNVTRECLAAIANLGFSTNCDYLLNEMTADKLDPNTIQLYEQSLKEPKKVQEFVKLLQFISERADALDVVQTNYQQPINLTEEDNLSLAGECSISNIDSM